jgi:hypothetical protein
MTKPTMGKPILKGFFMKSSHQYLSPKSDALEQALNGIDLCLKQNNSLDQNSSDLHTQFQQVQKQNSKFAATGLWRKKRDIRSVKTNI